MKKTRAKSTSGETLWAFIDRKAAHKTSIGCFSFGAIPQAIPLKRVNKMATTATVPISASNP